MKSGESREDRRVGEAAKASVNSTNLTPSPPRCTAARVVKIGGSLLMDQLLETRLSDWLDAQTPSAMLLVVGGGTLADAVRALDHRHGLPEPAAHEQAIRAMQVNSYVLSQLCPELNWIARLGDWAIRDSCSLRAILDPLPFLLRDEPKLDGKRLPCGWQVTSDSIAARVAHLVAASELVLLKSTLPVRNATSISYRAATDIGYVDQYFPVAAEQLPRVRAVNLRHRAFLEIDLTRQ